MPLHDATSGCDQESDWSRGRESQYRIELACIQNAILVSSYAVFETGWALGSLLDHFLPSWLVALYKRVQVPRWPAFSSS